VAAAGALAIGGLVATGGSVAASHDHLAPEGAASAMSGRVAAVARADTLGRATNTVGRVATKNSVLTAASRSTGRLGEVRSAGSGVVAEAPQPDGHGFWSTSAYGGVTSYGAAPYEGGLANVALNAPVISITATPSNHGYWLLGSDGGIFEFGGAGFYGSLGNIHLNAPIVGMASTPDGRGYWLVAADGGVFEFGDAHFYGSLGNIHLNAPIVGMAPTPNGQGYWLVAADGGVFEFGNAGFHGSLGNIRLNEPVVGMASTSAANGYWLLGADGGVFEFGAAPFYGSAAGRLTDSWAVGMISTGAGYWIDTTNGNVLSFGNAPQMVGVSSVGGGSTSSPLGDPSVNMTPSSQFHAACMDTMSSTCNAWAELAINQARASEGIGPLELPPDYGSMNPTDQLVAVTNAERTSRGLPAFAGPEGNLDGLALNGVLTNTDPSGPGGTTWAANWSLGYNSPLAADYIWMYDDGIGSPNLDCTASNEIGCWGHRRNILAPWGGYMGAAAANFGVSESLAELFMAS
jgi:hypothetical protein